MLVKSNPFPNFRGWIHEQTWNHYLELVSWILWVVSLPSHSHHQDYDIFRIKNPNLNLHLPNLPGKGTTQWIIIRYPVNWNNAKPRTQQHKSWIPRFCSTMSWSMGWCKTTIVQAKMAGFAHGKPENTFGDLELHTWPQWTCLNLLFGRMLGRFFMFLRVARWQTVKITLTGLSKILKII